MANAVEIMIRAKDYASEVFERLGTTGRQAGSQIEGAMQEAGESSRRMGNQVEGAMDDAETAIDDVAQAAQNAGDDMEAAADQQGEAMQGVTEKIGMASAAMGAYAQLQKDVNSRLDKFAYLSGMSEDATNGLAKGISDANFGMEETVRVMEQARKEGVEGEAAILRYSEGWKTVAKATGREIDELLEFSPILDRANASLADGEKAMDAFGWVTKNTTSSIPAFMDAVAGSMVDIGDAEFSLDQMAAALKIVEEKYGVTGPEAIAVFQTKIGEAAAAVDANGNEMGWSMETFADAIGTTTGEIDTMASSVAGSATVMKDLAGIQDKNATMFDKMSAKLADFNTENAGAIQAMGSMGTIMGGLTPIILLAMNAKAIYTTVTLAATAAATGFGAVMTFITGPIGLVMLAIAAVIGIGYLLIKNWDKVKEVGTAVWGGIVSAAEKAWEALKFGAEIAFKMLFFQWILAYHAIKAGIDWIVEVGPNMWDGIKDGAAKAFGFVKGIWTGIGSFFTGLWDGIVTGLKAPFNFFIETVNKMIGAVNGMQIKVPNWVPGIGGEQYGFNIPSVPRLHTGGVFNAPTGQREGLALLKQGEMVLDPMTSRKENNSDNRTIIVRVELEGQTLMEAMSPYLVEELLVRGG